MVIAKGDDGRFCISMTAKEALKMIASLSDEIETLMNLEDQMTGHTFTTRTMPIVHEYDHERYGASSLTIVVNGKGMYHE